MVALIEPTKSTGMWATFRLADEVFALRVEDAQEVLMNCELTPVPLAPDYVVGLLNLRGQIMTVIDLRRRLLFPPRPPGSEGQHLLVVKSGDRLASLLVDEIGDVLEVAEDGWRPSPDTLAARHRKFVTGICLIEGEVLLGLDVSSLL